MPRLARREVNVCLELVHLLACTVSSDRGREISAFGFQTLCYACDLPGPLLRVLCLRRQRPPARGVPDRWTCGVSRGSERDGVFSLRVGAVPGGRSCLFGRGRVRQRGFV